MNILDIEELYEKLEQSFKKYSRMIVQKEITGDEYRLLVFKGKVILSIHRSPASVIGDGNTSVSELMLYENKHNKLRGTGYTRGLTNIEIDDELLGFISKQGLNLDSIPTLGKKVQLRGNSNIGTGGTMLDVSDLVSEDIKNIACKSAEALGLEIAGVDIITTDIGKSLQETGGIVLEINETPGLGGDRELTGVNTAKVILEAMFFNSL